VSLNNRVVSAGIKQVPLSLKINKHMLLSGFYFPIYFDIVGKEKTYLNV